MAGWGEATHVNVSQASTRPQPRTCSMAALLRYVNIYFVGNELNFYSKLQVAYYDSYLQGSTTYSMLYVCMECPPGCDTCSDDTPCLAEYSWGFRLILLSVSLFCAISSIVTILLVINYRKIKVFKYSSPTFLSLTLIGCGIMYRFLIILFNHISVLPIKSFKSSIYELFQEVTLYFLSVKCLWSTLF